MCRMSNASSSVRGHLEKAIQLAGSQKKLGEKVGLSQNAIWYALNNGRVSAELAAAIEKATNGAVSKSDLRPDLFEAA